MSLFSKSLSTNFYSKRVLLHVFKYNKIGFTCAEFYSGTKIAVKEKAKIQLHNVPKRKIFKFANYNSLVIKLNQLSKSILLSSKHKYYGFLWYKTLDAINIPEYFSLLQLPDTFYSRFKIIELYVWMLLYHLPQGNGISSLVRCGLVEAMWEDTEKRAKLLDSFNINFRKNMKSLYIKFKVSLTLYDLGFAKNDMALCSSVWYSLFDAEDVDPRILEVVISFIRHQMNYLQKLDLALLTVQDKKSEIWIPLEHHWKEIFKP